MKTIRRVEVKLHAFLISALDGYEWSASWLGQFTLAKIITVFIS